MPKILLIKFPSKLLPFFLGGLFLVLAPLPALTQEEEPQAPVFKNPNLTPLDNAILANNMELVKSLVEKRTPLNPKDTQNGFPLMFAVIANNPQMVEYLIQKGAQVDAEMKEGVTPLAMAVSWNLVEVAEILIKHKANVNKKVGGSSLINLSMHSQYSEMTILLQRAGAKWEGTLNPAPAPAPSKASP